MKAIVSERYSVSFEEGDLKEQFESIETLQNFGALEEFEFRQFESTYEYMDRLVFVI